MAVTPEQDHQLSLLMREACEGSKESYARLLRDVCGLLQGFLIRRLGPGPDSEDVLQEILVSIHGARHTYDPQKPFVPWLFAIARFRIVDHWRKATRRLDREDLNSVTEAAEPAVNEEAEPMSERLVKSLDRLPVKQRQVIDLLKMKGYSIRDAARKLEMTETALKVTAHRAYRFLRREFEVETDE